MAVKDDIILAIYNQQLFVIFHDIPITWHNHLPLEYLKLRLHRL